MIDFIITIVGILSLLWTAWYLSKKENNMSLYNYPNLHEFRDLVSIYHEDEWNDAEIVLWCYKEKQLYKLAATKFKPSTYGNTKETAKDRNEIIMYINPLDSEKYSTKWKDIKFIVNHLKGDYDWDNAEIIVSSLSNKKQYSIAFCGSSRGDRGGDSKWQINFILTEKGEE